MSKSKERGDIDIKNKEKRIITILIIIVVIIVLFTPMVGAKYEAVEILKSSNKIATPIFIVEGTETTKISEINNIGYYEFVIKNFNETKISETGFSYTIEIISNTDESVQFELYQEGQLIELQNLKTNNLSIPGNERVERKYKLKVKYDSSLGTNGKDILEEVQVKVHSEQQKIG